MASTKFLRQHWKVFGGIVLVYGVLNILLVRGLGNGLNLPEIKASLQEAVGGDIGNAETGVALFALLVGSGSQTAADPSSALYQPILLLIVSLALIWALRQLYAGKETGARDAFYKGMYPLIPFLLVLMVISLQFLPMLLGGLIFNTVTSGGIAVTAIEQVLWGLLFFLLVVLSIYMVSSSAFALYIVTLPNMTPLKALRSARQLVLNRRWGVMRKVLFLPAMLLLLSVVLLMPLILFATPLAEAAFFVFSMIAIALVHSYMYALYRALL